MSPPPFDPKPVSHKTKSKDFSNFSYKNPYISYNDVLRNYSDWLVSLDYKVVDQNQSLSEFIDAKRKADSDFHLSKDGIHPDLTGHLLMAYNFLNSINLKMDKELFLLENETIMDEPIFKLVHERRKMRSKAWLEFIGYTRGKVVKTDSVDEIESKTIKLKEEISQKIAELKSPNNSITFTAFSGYFISKIHTFHGSFI